MWRFIQNVNEPETKKRKTDQEKRKFQERLQGKRVETFQQSWITKFKWLRFDEDSKLMYYCTVCEKHWRVFTAGEFKNA